MYVCMPFINIDLHVLLAIANNNNIINKQYYYISITVVCISINWINNNYVISIIWYY